MKSKQTIWLLLVSMIVCLRIDAQTIKKTNQTYYQNPVMGGDYPDPSVLRDGNDYYITHSSFEYYPGLLIWHSTDLVHWERIAYALQQNVGSVWAPDLVKYKDKFYIYFPANKTNWVVTASSPKGPWSAPVDLNLHGFIDPGHVVGNDGKRYLYLSNGYLVQLSEDGLSTVGTPEPGYKGWQYPKEWSTECYCLESPKSTVKDGWFYQTVAEGGTAGPATSHMVVSGRARSPHGPWENSPYNPIVHTSSRKEKWWSQGHGTLVDDVNGNWWILYHSYEKYFQTLGRQTLMLPIEWTSDGWFKVPAGKQAADVLLAPAGKNTITNSPLSDDFNGDGLALQWQGFKQLPGSFAQVKNGQLELTAKGPGFETNSPLLVNTADEKYEVEVAYQLEEGATAGLTLFYNEQGNMRVSVDKEMFTVYNQKNRKISIPNEWGMQGFLKIKNDENEVSFYCSADGKNWTRIERTIDATGFNHNVFGGFMSLRAGLFAFGSGKVLFDDFIYRKLP